MSNARVPAFRASLNSRAWEKGSPGAQGSVGGRTAAGPPPAGEDPEDADVEDTDEPAASDAPTTTKSAAFPPADRQM